MKKRIISGVLSLAMIISLCACGGNGGKSKSAGLIADDETEKVNIVWFISTSEPKGFKDVMDAANEYLGEKLNISLDLRCIEPGDYDSKVQLAAAAGEQCDIIWTSNWSNDYEGNVSKHAFLAIDDYLELPELSRIKNLYKEQIWDACRVNGSIYGVPVEQVLHQQSGMWFIKDICDKYNIDPYTQIKTTDDLEDVYQTVRDGEPDSLLMTVQGLRVGTTLNQEVASGWCLDENGNATDRSDETDYGIDWYARMRRWNQKGFFPVDIATFEDKTPYLNEGKLFSSYDRYMAGSEDKVNLRYDYKVCQIPTSNRLITRTAVQSTLLAINYNCKNPVRALKLIQLMHEDEYMLNLLCYGIEGRDYTRDDPSNPKRMNRDSDGYYIAEFMMGSQFLAYLAPSYGDSVWEDTKVENDTADIDPNIGFSFDRSGVATEITNVSSVNGEYTGLNSGLYENYEEMYNELQEKRKLAGSDIIKDEIERQYKEWKDAQ